MSTYYVHDEWEDVTGQIHYAPANPIEVEVDYRASEADIIRKCAHSYWHNFNSEPGDQETLVIRKTPDGPVYIRQRVEFRYAINITWQDEEGGWHS